MKYKLSGLPNELGETTLDESPKTLLTNGLHAIPQQFYFYQRTKENTEEILSKIAFETDFPLFVHEEHNAIFIQVGIIGYENYPKFPEQKVKRKIVYGRRWYIEPYTPTSEVIQTAYLALQKAREHELREILHCHLKLDGQDRKTTPFNTHIDLPLMSSCADSMFSNAPADEKQSANNVCHETILPMLSLGDAKLTLQSTHAVDDGTFFSIRVSDAPKESYIARYFPEQLNHTHHFFVQSDDVSVFIHTLFERILAKSNQHIAEHFTYDGFKRFSQTISPLDIAKFSLETRIIDKTEITDTFTKSFKAMSAMVDGAKAPLSPIHPKLIALHKHSFDEQESLDGFLPKEAKSF